MIIEGKNPVRESLKGTQTVNKLYIAKNIHDTESIIEAANAKRVKIIFTDKQTLDKLSPTGKHQGVLAVADEYRYADVDEIRAYAAEKGEKLLLLLLDGVEDPHNLGSIIRTAECAGVHGIVIPKHRAVSVNDTVLKTSAGAAGHVKVAMVTNINDVIRRLKDEFVNIIAADMDGESLYEAHFDGDTAIVIGGEGEGIKPLTRKLCESVVSIPQYGKINSLNASVAAGIIIYEAIRQRKGKCTGN